MIYLDENQIASLQEQAASVLIAPTQAEINLKAIELFDKAEVKKQKIEGVSGFERFATGTLKGFNYLGEAIASIPETLYDVAALPQNLGVKLGILPENWEASSEKFKKDWSINNPLLDAFIKEQENQQEQIDIYDKKRFETTSPSENFSKGNYYDGFVTMGNAIGESAGVSLAFMYGGATKGIAKTGKFMTGALTGTELRQQREEYPEQTEFDNVTKSIGLAGAESFFAAISSGTLGKVYKDIIFKQGKEAGEITFKNGLITMYETALKKYGIAVAPLGEGIEEVATQITQNLINQKPVFEGVTDAFLIGIGSGGVYGAPITAVQAKQGIDNAITWTKIRNILKDTPGPKNVKKTFQEFNQQKTTDKQIKIASIKNSDVILKQDLEVAVNNNDITQKQADNILKDFYNTQGTVNRVKSLNLTESSEVEAVSLLKRKNELQKKINTVKEKALTESELSEIETIDNRLREISKESSDVLKTKDIATTKKFAKGVGFKIVETNNASNQKALEEAAPEDFDIENDYGFISGNKIFLNNKVLDQLDNYEVTTASHELLHGVLTKSLLDGDLTKKNVEDFIKKSYGEKNLEFIKIKMAEMGYTSDYLNSRPDEYLTQLYDANLLGKEGAFEKAARYIERLIRKTSGGKYNWSFATKDDLGSFLRSYKESFETGVLSKRLTQSKFFNEAQDTDTTALSKTIVAENKRLSEQLKNSTEQEAIDIKNDLALNNEGIVNDFVNSKFKSGLGITKEEFKSGVQEEVLVYLNRTYDPSKGEYGAYIREGLFGGGKFGGGRLGNILKRLGQEGDLFTKEIDDRKTPETLDTTTEEITETVVEKPTKAKESLRKKIKLTDATSKKIVDAVVKTFGTKLPPVDSKQFKQALQKAFRTELKTTIAKDVLGSRAAYETFLRDNFEAIIEALPQDVINKRFRPFAEDTGKREKTKEGKKIFKKKDITKAEFIKYFLGRDVGTSTKGTRKDALAEALAQEFATDATMQTIQRPDVKEKREFVDKTQTTEKVSKAIDRPKDFAFSKGKKSNINIFIQNQLFESTDNDFAKESKFWKNVAKELGITPLQSDNPKDVEAFQNWVAQELPNYFGKEILTSGAFAGAGTSAASRNFFFTSIEQVLDKVKDSNFRKTDEDIKAAVTKQSYTSGEGKNRKVQKKFLNTLWGTKKLEKQNAQKLKGLEKIFLNFEKMMNDPVKGKENAKFIIAMLSSTSQGMGGLVRVAAPINFLAKNIDGVIVEEHTLPASLVAKYLFNAAIQGNVKKSFPPIKKNYFQGILSKIDDNKLAGTVFGKKYNYKSVTPEGWVLEDNIWARYFNAQVANNNFGIDPNNIVLNNGKSVYDTFGINSAGYQVPVGYNRSIIAAASKNRSMLPKSVQPIKGTTNNVVLSEMKSLDNQANEARSALSKGKNLNKDFNDIIERATGIGTEKRYGRTKATAVGANKGRFDLLGIPPSAQDFVGLTRYFAGKGKKGDETIAWVKENFLDPFARANIDISNARVALANDFKALKNLLGVSPKDLNKKITGEPYTVGNAVRVYTWIQQGMTVPGLSKADQKILEDYVTADENLVTFANELIAINKDNGYPKPGDSWLAGTITTDLLSGLNTVVRAKYLQQWQNNVNEVFTEENMNKLEAAFGKGYRDALENMLGRMRTGSNRGFKGDTLTGRFIDWINNSVGAIMFFNMRSAVLQTISAVNFVNFTDNNPLKAAAAFGNQPQYWSDVIKLMNSDYLVERRNGLKINVSEADIAEIAAESKNKAKAFVSKILKLGFLPTQIADSFAIASGGATFYRNRYKSLKKEGLSDKEAEAQAFQDFREIAEENQQSSRPDRISQQQAGPMGRIILAFANTPAQYARLMQKAASDLKNRRGDAKTNISKILYYGFIQNVIFNALQQALFAMAFADEEPDEEKKNKKYTGIVNGMADSLLRGVGFHGAAVATLKNTIMKLAEGKEAQDAAIELLDISPPISSKIGKLKSAGRTWDWNKKEIREKGWSLDNPAWLASGQVISAATNIPLDRGIRKLQNLKEASDAENEEWMRVANALGWQKWELEWTKDKPKNKKIKIKTRGSTNRSLKFRKQEKRN